MRSEHRLGPIRATALAWALASAALGCGRGSSGGVEMVGPEVRDRLPAQVAEMVPEDAILCLDDARPDGSYRLWLLRRPGGTWLERPASSTGRKGAARGESHGLPPSTLLGILRSRLPGLNPGEPLERRCRFTHWKASDGAELQLRELITDQGWFASVERVAM